MTKQNIQNTRVVILAGGKGTRLRPYTTVFPKPLMPISDMPILEVLLRQLKQAGFRKITLSVNHLAELLRTFFGDGSKLGLEISYCMEDKPLGTAGSLSLVENVSENFLVMNGDLLTTIDFAKMVDFHVQSQSLATIGVFPRNVHIDFGVLDIDSAGYLKDYVEKPDYPFLVSMGINAFHKSVLQYIPHGEYLDIPTLIMNMKKGGEKILTFKDDCEWLDIGRPDDYERAIELFQLDKEKYLIDDGE